MNQFDEEDTEIFFNELLISCEGIEFSTLTKININLDIL